MGRVHFKTLQSIFCFATGLSWADLSPHLLERQPSVQCVSLLAMGLEVTSLAVPGIVLTNHAWGVHALAWLLLASPLSLSGALPFSGTPDLLTEDKYIKVSEELKKLLQV